MALENCVANTPFLHSYAMTAYGAGSGAFTKALALERFDLKGTPNTVQDEGMNGSLWRQVGSQIIATMKAGGSIAHNPRADELQTLFPCLMGGTFVGNTLTPTKICEFFSMGTLDPTALRQLKYTNLVTNTWEIAASDSSPLLKLTANLEGQTRNSTTGVSGWPVLLTSNKQPMVFRQCTLTLNSANQRVKSVRITGNNNIIGDDFFNSLTRVEMPCPAQDFALVTELPVDTGTIVDYGSGAITASAEVEFVSGGDSLKFEFPNLFATPSDPAKSGRNRLLNTIEWSAQVDPAAAGYPVRVTAISV